jgi:hypothetical protein
MAGGAEDDMLHLLSFLICAQESVQTGGKGERFFPPRRKISLSPITGQITDKGNFHNGNVHGIASFTRRGKHTPTHSVLFPEQTIDFSADRGYGGESPPLTFQDRRRTSPGNPGRGDMDLLPR